MFSRIQCWHSFEESLGSVLGGSESQPIPWLGHVKTSDPLTINFYKNLLAVYLIFSFGVKIS